MPDSNSKSNEGAVQFLSNGDFLEIREEDTRPGHMSERSRKALEEKYGRKPPPASGPTEPPKEE